MAELQKQVEELFLRLDHMGLRVERAVSEAVRAAQEGDLVAADKVIVGDTAIDRMEVEIEQECIRLLALYQPTAIDLRTLFTIIKANNDLERISDLAVGISRRIRDILDEEIIMDVYPGYSELAELTCQTVGKTVRMLGASDAQAAREVIETDRRIDSAYKEFVRSVIDRERQRADGVETAVICMLLARALERIGDLCTNIAEDIIFLRTGEIVRHAAAFHSPKA